MARKLTSEEECAFAQALQDMGGPPSQTGDPWVAQALNNKRETTLSLVPELERLFGEDPPIGWCS
jgi:hypothetical protein